MQEVFLFLCLMDYNNLSKEDIHNVDLPEAPHNVWYQKPPGKEHYQLLAYLCFGCELVYDVGTYKGYSAYAMSTADSVISYDIYKCPDRIPEKKNVKYVVGNVLADKKLFEADLILLDTYHDGIFEKEFLYHLIDGNYSGKIVVDDIYLNKEMQIFWDTCISVSQRHYDLTDLGHYTGTGLILL